MFSPIPTINISSPFQTKKVTEDRERERQLSKKVTDLTNQVSRLEKRVNVLKAENDGLVRMLSNVECIQ